MPAFRSNPLAEYFRRWLSTYARAVASKVSMASWKLPCSADKVATCSSTQLTQVLYVFQRGMQAWRQNAVDMQPATHVSQLACSTHVES